MDEHDEHETQGEQNQTANDEPGATPAASSGLIVVGIGASAGGIQALQAFFDAVPEQIGVAFVVVVHLSPEHRSALPAILAARTSMPVTQVTSTVPLEGNHVYVIPPDRRLEITDRSVAAIPFDEPRGRRAPIDQFFRSLAAQHGDGFAVVLSGGGSDGAIGVKAIKEAGGLVLVQDPAEAAHDSMPRAAIATQVADLVLPVRDLARRIGELAQAKRRFRAPLGGRTMTRLNDDDDAAVEQILNLLHARTGHDFRKYKRATVLRRIGRRMQVQRTETLEDYAATLRQNPDEAQALFADLLISVTSFFRDAESWDALAKQVIPRVLDELESARDADAKVRVWVPGCATGEEAYSIAMLLLEEVQQRGVRREVQIFASDLDEGALATARAGRYPRTIAVDVSEARLRRFFTEEDDQYVVTKEVRDCVIFTAHSVLRDPPFSRVDLVCCRNLLIYLDRDLQQRVFGVIHYALNPGGYLFVGASETAEGASFRVLDKKHRIFQARQVTKEAASRLPDLLLATPRLRIPEVRDAPTAQSVTAAAAHRRLLEDLGPPSVLVDEERSAVHLSETVGRFLEPPGGSLTRDVTRLVRSELQGELRVALLTAFDRAESTLTPFIPVCIGGTMQRVAVLVRPRRVAGGERLALVVFIEAANGTGALAESDDRTHAQGEQAAGTVRRDDSELRQMQERLVTAREQAEANNEALRAANEELQSINEEYRSTAEELETSKEELQSINEELETVNAELKLKFEEVSRAHSDLENLMAATEIGTLFLDRSLRIARLTPPIRELFNVTDGDRGRPITDFTHHLDYDELEADAWSVLRSLRSVDREVLSDDDRSFLVRLRPYRTVDDRVDGVVVTFVDITARRRVEEELRRSLEQFRLLMEGVGEYAMIMTDPEGRITTWNSGARKLFGRTEGETIGQTLSVLFTDDDRLAGVPERELATAIQEGAATDDRWQQRKDGTRFWASGSTTALRDASGTLRGFARILRDNTARQAAEAARFHFQALFESAPGLYVVLRPDNYEVLAASDAYVEAMMTKREDIVGRGLFEAFPDDPSEPNADGVRNLTASFERVKATRRTDAIAVQRYPIRRPASDGGQFEERWWSPVNSPVAGPDGDIAYIIHRVEDITPFIRWMKEEGREGEGHRLLESRARHMEADIVLRAHEIHRVNEELSRLNALLEVQAVEHERLLSAAQRAREEAERKGLEALAASEVKTQFVATMSHELRTPLNAIAGHVQLLDMEVHGPMTATQHEALARVERAQRHLLALINDVLNFTRLDAGRVEYDLRPTELGVVMSAITPMMETQLKAKGLIYEVRPPRGTLLVWADADKLRQILLNLIANAVKFTPRGGRVAVDVDLDETQGVAKVQVRDSGIGIPREKQDAVFHPFVQINRSLTRPMEGIGLGLTISRDLARGMGGDLTLESAEGRGSTFTVTLRRVAAGE
jgi:two-component system, chemotaxis family, CheB/CheR fusion protein